ncbi:hypothetical protein N7468_008474 [Penicillium chermesinum]|uniref:Uncharacterized protein n=1 Tax=Penicillium chermesinum TaxID=63820 RepID=A0A9W9NPS7_9EURO|nr:uncharacterized protein N7468_008474 [Penicillium chermesinum]KAJ5223932.1 hypothetical protein N7468_008474 [Penicillium chermesinum]
MHRINEDSAPGSIPLISPLIRVPMYSGIEGILVQIAGAAIGASVRCVNRNVVLDCELTCNGVQELLNPAKGISNDVTKSNLPEDRWVN